MNSKKEKQLYKGVFIKELLIFNINSFALSYDQYILIQHIRTLKSYYLNQTNKDSFYHELPIHHLVFHHLLIELTAIFVI
ncbi:hypothetical protein SFC52_10355 [Niallia circulans]|uniref:hypothetical protein n=1 Tax=Niallia circulans TaxID=1397 RepID=UPI0011A20486